MRIPLRVSLACFVLLSVPAVRADAPPTAKFEGALDVRVVNVEAVVTDARGRRVPDLKASDFRLLVDDQEVPIDFFSEVRDGETVQSSPEVEATRPAPQAAPAPGPASINYLVFIDDKFDIQAQRDFVLRRVMNDLRNLGPADRLAIVSYDGRRLTRILDWTTDRSAIESGFKTAILRPSHGIEVAAERAELRNLADSTGLNDEDLPGRTPATAGEGAAAGNANSGGVLQVTSDYGPYGRAIMAATASMRGMSNPPGRKVFFILSAGWPVPGSVQLGTLENRTFLQKQANADLREYYRPLTDAANLLGYAIYPVDLAGTNSVSTFADPSTKASVDITRLISSEWDQGVEAGMGQMARETGGKAILNSARLNAFERMASDAKTYYGFGFSPEWQADGRHHEIRLETRRPGLKVRARKGFSDLRKATEVALRNESLLFFGGDAFSQRLLLSAGEPVKAGFGKVAVPVTIEMPIKNLTALSDGEKTHLQGILSMEALDRWGRRTDLGMVQLRITGSGAPAEGAMARYEAKITLPKGEQHLVFIVRDDAGDGEVWGALDLKAYVRR